MFMLRNPEKFSFFYWNSYRRHFCVHLKFENSDIMSFLKQRFSCTNTTFRSRSLELFVVLEKIWNFVNLLTGKILKISHMSVSLRMAGTSLEFSPNALCGEHWKCYKSRGKIYQFTIIVKIIHEDDFFPQKFVRPSNTRIRL
jgi:hypothetical protein